MRSCNTAEIYKQVKEAQNPPFRPILDVGTEGISCSEELANMIKKCWDEDPGSRPDFHALKAIIRKITNK